MRSRSPYKMLTKAPGDGEASVANPHTAGDSQHWALPECAMRWNEVHRENYPGQKHLPVCREPGCHSLVHELTARGREAFKGSSLRDGNSP